MTTSNKNFKVKNGLDVNGQITVAAVGGDEGGQVNLEKPITGTDLAGNVAIDIYQNKIRIFDTGGSTRGAYIDLSAAGESVSSNLLAGGGGGITSVVEDTTPQLGGDLDTNGNDITSINALTMDTTPTGVPTDVGTLSWNGTDETLNVKLNSAVTLQVGQEHVVHAKNMTGSTIPDVSAVMFAGAAGNKVRVTPAVATLANEPYTFVGITAQAIPDGELGFVTQFGMINDIDTSGWTDGALLYVDPATPGALTDDVPSSPNWTFPVAAVIASHASAGKILVRAMPEGHLHDLVDVGISSPADNEVLAYNSADDTWINQTASEAGLAALSGATFSGTVVMNNVAVDINDTDSRVGRIIGAGNIMYIQGGADSADTSARVIIGRTASTSNISQLDLRADITNIVGNVEIAQEKNAVIASGYNSASGGFANSSRVVMTATATGSSDPTTRPDGTALQAGDIWIDW